MHNCKLGPRLQICFMLNLAEHNILNSYKYKIIKTFNFSSGSDKPIMLFILLINVKRPGILTFIRRKKFMLVLVEHEKV